MGMKAPVRGVAIVSVSRIPNYSQVVACCGSFCPDPMGASSLGWAVFALTWSLIGVGIGRITPPREEGNPCQQSFFEEGATILAEAQSIPV